jgi:hypothetical protein
MSDFKNMSAEGCGIVLAGWLKIFFWVVLLACAVEGCAMLQKIDSSLQRLEYLQRRADKVEAFDPYYGIDDETVAAIFVSGNNTPLVKR